MDCTAETNETTVEARRLLITGRVQGVGFRPFVFRLASRFALSGSVQNRQGDVAVLVHGPRTALDAFVHALSAEAPPLAAPRIVDDTRIPVQATQGFRILPSDALAPPAVHVPPDSFVCPDCLAELNDPSSRRYRYAFINCTQCGPRYTLIRRLPYDRSNTTMASFDLCPACAQEYADPGDRRFHAEPTACPQCGPQLRFRQTGATRTSSDQALEACITALRQGLVVAVKGVGGYHLICDARNRAAVARLRATKPRPHKPLAVMVAESLLDEIALPSPARRQALLSATRPIVLCEPRPGAPLADNIAPRLTDVGLMLPYSPLHHLIAEAFGGPLVVTSGNVSGEPVLTDGGEVERRLGHAADAFLHHDRPIARPADDSVYRVIAGRARPLRLGRGCSPLEMALPLILPRPLLALGGHMKNTVTLAWGDRAVVSPHIGDLDSPRSLDIFEQVVADLQTLYGVRAEALIVDAHPGYASRRWAEAAGLPVVPVFHHHAHASALAGEYPEVARWLVFTWDGVGLGEDGTLWGGEALLGRPGCWRRAGSFRPFRLPGGEKAGRQPWRPALALCWESGHQWPGRAADPLLRSAWERGQNAPVTSAVGRLFDAAAALTGMISEATFEGQGPMYLEAECAPQGAPIRLPLSKRASIWTADWSPLVPMLLDDERPVGQRAADFHETLALALLQQARAIRAETAVDAVGLCGGVFQNRRLTERTVTLLEADGFTIRLNERVPCNDGGLSFGQVIEAGCKKRNRE